MPCRLVRNSIWIASLGVVVVAAASVAAESADCAGEAECSWPCAGSRHCADGLDDWWAGDVASAARSLQAACDGGNAYGCRYSACLIQQGRGVESSTDRMRSLFRLACDGGDGASCTELHRWSYGPDDRGLLLRACELGDASGCLELAWQLRSVFVHGSGPAEQIAVQTENLVLRACSRGSVEACVAVARLLRDWDAAAAHTREVVRQLRAACSERQGGCDALADIYLHGRLVAQDLPAVARFRSLACRDRGGFDPSCSRLDGGAATESGPDSRRAARQLRLACEAGESASCRYLAFLVLRGDGVSADIAVAASLFRRACAGGDAYSCSFLGNLYERGALGEVGRARAVALYRQGGDDYACGPRSPAGPITRSVRAAVSRAAR